MTDTVLDTNTPTISTSLDGDSGARPDGGGSISLSNVPVSDQAETDVEVVDEGGESVRESLMKAAAELDKGASRGKVNENETASNNAKVAAKDSSVSDKVDSDSSSKVSGEKASETDSEDNNSVSETEKTSSTEEVAEKGAVNEGKVSDTRQRTEPPSQFLPRAKELWVNTPREVQSEVSRLTKSHQEEVEQYKASKAFHDELKEYDELARQTGTTLKQALTNYVTMERTLAANPAQGMRALIENMGMKPQQAMAAIAAAYGADLKTVAEHVLKNPQEYSFNHNPVAQAQPVQNRTVSQAEEKIAQLEKQLQDIQISMAHKQYIEPFIQTHPRYYELEGDIEFFLQSGKVPNELSPIEKLEVAYDMAERLSPSPKEVNQPSYQNGNANRVEPDFSGKKSIKTSPGKVSDNHESVRKLSRRELLIEEMNRLSR